MPKGWILGCQNGTQEASKTTQKSYQNFDRFLDGFWSDFGGPNGHKSFNSWRAGGMRGAWLDSFEFEEFEDSSEIHPDTLRQSPTLRVAADS